MVDLQSAGLGMNTRMTMTMMFALGLFANAAFAQSETGLREGELTIDIDVRFISTYRDGSWVPVDVVVNNNERDIEGYLEVVAKQAGVAQPPSYRVPVDSPKGSRKRFRLYCLLDGTTELEAMLYRGRRPALSAPMEISLRPIGQNDYLCLILDNQPADYGFLFNTVLNRNSDQGFYRVELRGDELSSLPDKLPCYEGIDLIVMGDVNPADISLRHRGLIKRYIENGGTLVVCAGANTPLYRGTWVEDLVGVSFGSQQVVNEQAFAEMALLAPSTDRLRGDKQGEFSPLTPNADDVMRWGGEHTLATLRPIGEGFVSVVSLDMAGKLLHTTKEFGLLWSQLVDLHATKPEINFGATSSFLRFQLANVAGVRVFPRSSVAAYLTLYLFVAIIGNWVFWSFMKRRELAWLCLVFLSFGFTAYAMIYGTAGRAKETELEQVNLVRIYEHTPVAKVQSTIGLLSARSARYSFGLADDAGLVSQGGFVFSGMYMGMPASSNRSASGSFAFVQGSRPRVEDLRVGASVMRTLLIESDLTLTGGVVGTLTHNENGLQGTLVNETGLQLSEPWIYYKGRLIRGKPKLGTNLIEVNMLEPQFDALNSSITQANQNPMYYGGYNYGVQSVQSAIRDPLAAYVFSSFESRGSLDTSLGPYLFGWASDSPPSAINLEEDAKYKIRETFVVADIRVEGEGAARITAPLIVDVAGSTRNTWRNPFQQFWYDQAHTIYWDANPRSSQTLEPVKIDPPRDLVLQAVGDLTVELRWTTEQASTIQFLPEGAPAGWSAEHLISKTPHMEDVPGARVNVIRYRVEDWRSYYDEDEGVLRGYVGFVPNQAGQHNRPGWAQFTVQAYLEVGANRVISEEWTAWP